MYDIDALKADVDALSFADRAGWKVVNEPVRNGRVHMYCPLHQKYCGHPDENPSSCTLDLRKKTVTCWACGYTKSLVDVYMEEHNVPFIEALNFEADVCGDRRRYQMDDGYNDDSDKPAMLSSREQKLLGLGGRSNDNYIIKSCYPYPVKGVTNKTLYCGSYLGLDDMDKDGNEIIDPLLPVDEDGYCYVQTESTGISLYSLYKDDFFNFGKIVLSKCEESLEFYEDALEKVTGHDRDAVNLRHEIKKDIQDIRKVFDRYYNCDRTIMRQEKRRWQYRGYLSDKKEAEDYKMLAPVYPAI